MRSDAIVPKIEKKVIYLLKTTTLSCADIGKIFNCSRGPITTILNKHNILRGKKYLPKKCKTCNKEFLAVRSKSNPNKGKFCSKQCYTQWQKSSENKGPNHPSWKGGYESKLQLLRKTDKWKQWRESIFKRDNYTCKKCQKIGGELHPHHIIPKSVNIQLIFDVNNGIILCKKCHMEIHRTNNKDFIACKPKVTNQYTTEY